MSCEYIFVNLTAAEVCVCVFLNRRASLGGCSLLPVFDKSASKIVEMGVLSFKLYGPDIMLIVIQSGTLYSAGYIVWVPGIVRVKSLGTT